jgi:signal peptidase II
VTAALMPSENIRRFAGRGVYTFIAALSLDRAAKQWALSCLAPAAERGDAAVLSMRLHFNYGISFSLLKNYSSASLVVASAGIFLLGLLCAKSKTIRRMPGMAFLWAGAAGNLTDRLAYGYVVDWLYAGWYANLADIWLCVGGLMVFVQCAKILKERTP